MLYLFIYLFIYYFKLYYHFKKTIERISQKNSNFIYIYNSVLLLLLFFLDIINYILFIIKTNYPTHETTINAAAAVHHHSYTSHQNSHNNNNNNNNNNTSHRSYADLILKEGEHEKNTISEDHGTLTFLLHSIIITFIISYA